MYKTGTYNILFPEELQDPYLSFVSIGLESRDTTDYYYDNIQRSSDSILFQYTLSGQGVFEIGDNSYDMLPGHAFFIKIPSDTKYYLPANAPDEPWVFIYIMLKGSHALKYYDLITQSSGAHFELPLENSVIQTVFNIFNQAKAGHIISSFFMSELLYRFLCQLCQNQIQNKENYSKMVSHALIIMENNYASLGGIEEISDNLNISFAHFTREFTKEIGTSPIKYLTNIRLSHSVKLLLETSLSINEIAAFCGFSSGNYFTKVFKKHMNITPRDYRLEWK